MDNYVKSIRFAFDLVMLYRLRRKMAGYGDVLVAGV